MADEEEYIEFDDDGIFWIEEAEPTVAVCLHCWDNQVSAHD